MTLPLNSRLSALYDTNGTQKEFGFGFRVFFDPDNGGYGLEVRRQTADGYEVIPKSDYLVLPVEDNSAGIVRFSVAPSAGQQIYIAGKTPTIQQLVLTNFGRYSAESIETQFDFITAIIQEWLSALGEETRQRIAADEILTQYVVQRIDAFVQQVNQNWDDKSQEIEDYIASIMPSFTQTLRDEIEAFAVAGMQDAIDQTLAESKAEIDDAVARANAAALAAAITGKVYDTPEAGVNPVTGVADGAYYNVRSPSDDSYLDEYQNIGGSAVATGKRYLSSLGVQLQDKAASTIKDASGESQQEINDRTVHIENYGAVPGGIIDCTAAFNLAKVDAKSRGVPITARDDAEYLINGVCYFDCDLSGGVYLLGGSADMQLKVESDDVYNIRATFKNVSGIDTKQALICMSSDGVNRRGDVRIDCKFYGFLQGVYGRYLRRFHILPTSYAYSRNTVAGRTAEAHFACVHTDLYIAQGESDGSVLGYSSGAGIVTDIYKCIARNSSDHGVYSSSPTNKRLTIFDNCITEDTGGSGQKCFSNGDVWMLNPTAHRIGKVALLPVGNRVFIRGGSVKDSVLSAVYQIGKEVGAGVNTFEHFEVDGLNAVNVGDHYIRVAGAEYIGKVVLKNLTGDTERALLNIATDVNVPNIEIENCPVLCKPTAEAAINVLNSANPSQKISIKGNVRALTNSANIIDVNTLSLTLDASFDFITAPRLVRNRNASGVCNIFRAEINSGSTTSGLILADSGLFTNARSVPTVNNNLTILHSTSAPTSGNFTKGSIVFNSNASVNGVLGWYCTASGSPGTWQAFGIIADANLRTQSTTTANLNNASSAINTANKYLGREVYDTTSSKFMKATGPLSTDSWISTDQATTITPA